MPPIFAPAGGTCDWLIKLCQDLFQQMNQHHSSRPTDNILPTSTVGFINKWPFIDETVIGGLNQATPGTNHLMG